MEYNGHRMMVHGQWEARVLSKGSRGPRGILTTLHPALRCAKLYINSPTRIHIAMLNILALELFFFNFSTPCI